MAKCDCYFQHGLKFLCYGTKEMEECSCGGDESKCDFYPEKRKQKTETKIRLIDANALIRKARWMEEPDGCGIPYDIMAVSTTAIEFAPTVDAVEVVHGYVIPADEPKHILMDRQCGICKNLMLATDNYCPMCGAINEGERSSDGQ